MDARKLVFIVCLSMSWEAFGISPADTASVPPKWRLTMGYSLAFSQASRTLTKSSGGQFTMDYPWMDASSPAVGIQYRLRRIEPSLQINYITVKYEGNYEYVTGTENWYSESALSWKEIAGELLIRYWVPISGHTQLSLAAGAGAGYVLMANDAALTERLAGNEVVTLAQSAPAIGRWSWAWPLEAEYRIAFSERYSLGLIARYQYAATPKGEASVVRHTLGFGLRVGWHVW